MSTALKMHSRRATLFGLAATALAGCAYEYDHGPPPHAPAHGYRRKHPGGPVLVYDSGIGVYVVSGSPGIYWYGDRFYRYYGGVWQVGVAVNGPWHGAEHRHLPPGLAKKYGPPVAGPPGGGPPGKGRGKGKGRDDD